MAKDEKGETPDWVVNIKANTKFIELAEAWLKIHYPDKTEPSGIRWSAVCNFALWLDKATMTLLDSKCEKRMN